MRRLFLALLALSLARAAGGTVVVLPFSNLSGSSNLDWIGESVAESVREALASSGLLVLDRESREEAFRRLSLRPYAPLTHASVIRVAEVLDAEQAVYGWFRVSSGSQDAPASQSLLTVTLRVADLQQLKQSAEASETAALEDLAEVQDRLAWLAMQRLLGPGKAPSEEQLKRRHKRVRLDALESYIRGLLATSTEQKHRFFTQAARLDEGFSRPCFELGRLLWSEKDYQSAAGWLERVPADSPNYMEASFLLGLCRYQLGAYDKAIASFRAVAEAVPLNEVWNDLGAAQSRRELPEAVESFRKALEGDPNDVIYHFNLGYALWKRSEFDAAADSFRAALDLDPEDAQATLMLGRCLKRTSPQQPELRIMGLERIKTNFDEMAYRQLRATLEKRRD